MRRKSLDEVEGIAAQNAAPTKAYPGEIPREEMGGVERDKICIVAQVDRHGGDDTHTQSQTDVSFDDVGITRRQDDVGLESRGGKKRPEARRAPVEIAMST